MVGSSSLFPRHFILGFLVINGTMADVKSYSGANIDSEHELVIDLIELTLLEISYVLPVLQ